MIVLSSNGLSSTNLLNIIKAEVSKENFKKAVLVVTADNEYKHDNRHVNRLSHELRDCGLSVGLFDFDTDQRDKLKEADVIEFNGGNPFYLLDRMKKSNMNEFLFDFLAKGKMIIGMSAGSFVLQKNIELVNEYSSEMNFLGLTDLTAMSLVDIEVLPHYSRFITRFDRFEERCVAYEKENNISVIRLDDGDGVICYSGEHRIVRKQPIIPGSKKNHATGKVKTRNIL